ncbi:MAG: nucleotidyltransferase domain-containing protein [Acidobacteria bacterium]|nr:nucleotidyltransferase domain-containing protein [Acidobacteriota bacterium]
MMEKLLNELVKRLQETYDEDLQSVVLYGSAASGDFQEKFSDLNVLCILRVVGVPELRKAEKLVEWWVKERQRAPLILSVEEAANSHDAFPIEFLDMQQNHRRLFGKDLLSGIEVSRRQHRQQVEHELRTGLLRLRERYLTVQRNEKEVVELMARSLATFATLARHTLILSKEMDVPIRKREIVEAAAKHFHLHPLPFLTVLEIREGTQTLSGEQVHSLFASYLEQITRLVAVVDRLESSS